MKAFFRFLLFLLTLIQFGFASPINLIKAEKEFIKNNPLIKVHCVLDASPFTFIQDDKCQGYSIDHIKLVASKVGLDIDIVTGFTWDQYIDQLKNNQLDVMLKGTSKNRLKLYTIL